MKGILIFTFLLSFSLSAQTLPESDEDLIPEFVAEETRSDEQIFKESIPKHLKEGKPQVYKYKNLYGYIFNDSILIPMKYYQIDNEYSDLMICNEPQKLFGAINKKGETIIPFEYISLTKNYDNILFGWKKNLGYGLMTRELKELVPFEYKKAVKIDSIFIFYSPNKQLIIKYLGDQHIEVLMEGTFDEIDIERTGKRQIFAVKEQGFWGLMNYQKQILLHCQYEKIELIDNQLAVVGKDGKLGIVDFKGNLIAPYEFDACQKRFKNGLFAMGKKNIDGKKLWGLVDTVGRIILPTEYENINQCMNSEMMIVKKNKKYGLIDIDGNLQMPVEFNQILEWKHMEVTPQRIEGKSIFVQSDLYGKYFIHRYSENELSGLWSLEKGELIMPNYDYFKIYENYGLIIVTKGNDNALYNTDGKQVIGLGFGNLRFTYLHPDIISAHKNNEVKLLSTKDGKQIQEEIYEEWFSPYTNEMNGYFLTKQNGLLALHNPNGLRLTNHQYELQFGPCDNLQKFKDQFGDLKIPFVCVYRKIDGNLVPKVLDETGQEYDLDWRNK